MRANPYGSSAEQIRELGLAVGDTIQGREEVGDYWHEARITLLWIGATHAAWIVSGRSSRPREGNAWSAPHEALQWDLSYREWERIETPPEHAALLPAPNPAAPKGGRFAQIHEGEKELFAVATDHTAWVLEGRSGWQQLPPLPEP
jgi:hypothetical protein